MNKVFSRHHISTIGSGSFIETDMSETNTRNTKVNKGIVYLVLFVLIFTCMGATQIYLNQIYEHHHTRSQDCLQALGTIQYSEELHNTEFCQQVIQRYIQKDYLEQIDLISDQAITQLEQYSKSNSMNGSQLLIFDIDETLLSNQFNSRLPDQFRVITQDQKKFLLKDNHFLLPIQSIHKVYNVGFKLGFKLHLVTGRYERSRNFTIENLRHAGYGSQCQAQDSQQVVKLSKQKEQERNIKSYQNSTYNINGDSNNHDNSNKSIYNQHHNSQLNQDYISDESIKPCYQQLDLRNKEEEDLPASVYKPNRRNIQEMKGLKIVASFGDQWSDLLGTNQAKFSYKLPNPFYYIP